MHQPSAHPSPRTTPARAQQPRMAIVASAWQRDIVASGTGAMQASFLKAGVPQDNAVLFEVPGAFEIPLHAKRLAQSGPFDAIIACGFVVNGGIYRHEFVAAAVIDALMRLQMDSDTPVFSAVLTPRDFHEHDEHHHFFREHFVKKGQEVVSACLATLQSLQRLPMQAP